MEDSDTISGAIIGSNDDLLTEILIQLPVTSIIRFKSVSKHWRLLLSNSHLNRRYDNNNLSKSLGLFGLYGMYFPFDVENPSPPPFRSLDFYFNRSKVRIKQSCNGLLLCNAFHNNGASEYYVFNPTTKQLAFIPSLPNIRSMALAFDQTHSPHYKVVCVCAFESRKDMFQIQIYSSETMKWKVCIESFAARVSDFHSPVYWNGSIHWAPDHLDNSFLYLKLDVEELQMLPVPEELASIEISTKYFGESRGHLHLIPNTDCSHRILFLNVYEMLRDRSGWFVKYRLQFYELRGFPEMLDYDLGVVDVVRGKGEEETFLVLLTPEKVMRYNIHDKSYNEIYSLAEDDFYDETSRYDFFVATASCHRYIEALSSF
ncbi:F-box protein At5g07610-like [Bidens hawaiensis]|uniref:F-box protein At5g07610-like n=1 Tax=Bidens hawaiensis TaxID=980011 RepID=UPI00404B92EB